jgi:sulfatase modifying factor 1
MTYRGLIGRIGLIGLISAAHGEHRSALIIDNHDYAEQSLALEPADIPPLQGKLLKAGFACTVRKNLDANQMRLAIEGFAETTPVNGKALLYFHGHSIPSVDQKSTLLADINSKPGRGYPLDAAFKALSTKGGSQSNHIVLDSPPLTNVQEEIPDDCHLNTDGIDPLLDSLPQTASNAISPPDKFALGTKAGEEWVNTRGMVFCWVPPGKSTMGSPETEAGRHEDEALREVEIQEGFWLSKYEFIRGHYKGNPNKSSVGSHKLDPVNAASQSKDILSRTLRPLTQDEQAKGRLPEGWEYGLPSEEQWEYAARAGTSTTYPFGNDTSQLPKYANFADKSMYATKGIFSNHAHHTLDDGQPGIAHIGLYAPTHWGLHDMHGNVSEWTDSAVIKGGSWLSTTENLRSAYREKLSDREQRNYIGFRIAIRKTPSVSVKNK